VANAASVTGSFRLVKARSGSISDKSGRIGQGRRVFSPESDDPVVANAPIDCTYDGDDASRPERGADADPRTRW
jgi:hypothetical protein